MKDMVIKVICTIPDADMRNDLMVIVRGELVAYPNDCFIAENVMFSHV